MVSKARQKARRRRRRAAALAVAPEAESAPGEMAVQYLQRWAERDADSGWKFSKKRQTWLLRAWPEPNKLGGDEFKQLLPYLRALAPSCRHDPPIRDRARGSSRMLIVASMRARTGSGRWRRRARWRSDARRKIRARRPAAARLAPSQESPPPTPRNRRHRPRAVPPLTARRGRHQRQAWRMSRRGRERARCGRSAMRERCA